MLPVTFEEPAERGFRLGPFCRPREALMGTAERPQQGQRLVKRQAAIRLPVPPQRGELLDQFPYCQARCRPGHLETETAQQASDGRRPAAEVRGGKGFLAWKEAVRGTHDRLRIVGLAVNHQTVRAGHAEPVLLEKPVLAKPVILRHGLENLAAGQFPQCHTDMVGTCVWQRLAVNGHAGTVSAIRVVYNKLVRDQIPGIIAGAGRQDDLEPFHRAPETPAPALTPRAATR